jgi:hypothetical protein
MEHSRIIGENAGVSVGATSAKIIEADNNRSWVGICNPSTSAASIFVVYGDGPAVVAGTAGAGRGWEIPPGGTWGRPWSKSVSAISASGTVIVSVESLGGGL